MTAFQMREFAPIFQFARIDLDNKKIRVGNGLPILSMKFLLDFFGENPNYSVLFSFFKLAFASSLRL